jgi:hypothetical protein
VAFAGNQRLGFRRPAVSGWLPRRALVKRREDWKWSGVHEYAFPAVLEARYQPPLRIDRVRIPADERARI